MNIKTTSVTFALLLLISTVAICQKSPVHSQPDANYRLAISLYDNGQFGAAKNLFDEVISQINDPHDERTASSLLYSGLCSAQLQNPDAEPKFVQFIERNSSHPGQSLAIFSLGKIKYNERKFRDAEKWFSQVDHSGLDSDLHDEFFFKKGHSQLSNGKANDALRSFFRVSSHSARYHAAARYYSGHVHYEQGNLVQALSFFEKLEDHPSFGDFVPYYIAHVYYLQNDYDKLIEYASRILVNTDDQRNSELSKLVGDAFFHKGEYENAIPYFETFFRLEPNRISRDDRFQLGYAYFVNKEYEKAIEQFERLISGNDAMAQNAHFHLGASYLHANQKHFARNAFLSAHQNNHDPQITQDALFVFAKLSHELSLDSFNEALSSFQKYVDQYPSSPRLNEAYQHLASIYLSTRNFRSALEFIEKTPIKTPEMREAFQRITYYRGVELFNGGSFDGAIELFDKSMTTPQVNKYLAQALYWKGEAKYRQGKFKETITNMEKFLTSPGAFSLKQFNQAHYTIGYSHFKNKNYNAAIVAFRKFASDSKEPQVLVNDAFLRIGDSYFIAKEYNNAIENYNRVIRTGALGADYATLQKGLAQGATNQFNSKINTLQELISKYPASDYVDNAKYEIGNAYLTLDNNQLAMNYFNQVINQHSNSSFLKSAMLKLGLIHYNNNQDREALAVFKRVIERHPGSPESHEALNALKNIYLNLNQVDEFVSYSSNLSFANVSAAQQDSLMYMAAENRYMQNDCDNAIAGFNSYLQKFSSGIFSINANFYLSECYFRAGNNVKALQGYKLVASKPKSAFTENSLRRASFIEFNQNQFLPALELFTRLEQVADSPENRILAKQGQMRSLFRLERYQECDAVANQLFDNLRISSEARQEAYLYRGKSALKRKLYSVAQSSFQNVVALAGNEMAAEAMYLLAYIDYAQGNYKRSEELIFEFTGKMSAHDYWLASSYILLADNYTQIGNLFQAKLTLQSIIDNYQGEDLRQVARQKLDAILADENHGQSGKTTPREINLNPDYQ